MHAVIKTTIIAFAAMFASVLIWQFSSTAHAQEQACTQTIAQVSAMLDAQGIAHVTIEEPANVLVYVDLVRAATGDDLTGAVRVFVADFGASFGLGFEDPAGCLSDPYVVAKAAVEPVRA